MAVLAVASRGRGRTLALSVDSTWLWAFAQAGKGGTPRLYGEFWRNAVRWLAQEPSSRFVSLEVAHEEVEPDTPVPAGHSGKIGPTPH